MSLDPSYAKSIDQHSTQRAVSPIAVVPSGLDYVTQVQVEQLAALNQIIDLLYAKLSYVLNSTPDAPAEVPKSPAYDSALLRFIDGTNGELAMIVERVRLIIDRLPT